jgi:hypothetical protein
MTPKEKAEQLVESFMNIKQQKLADYSIIYHPTAKQCALIAVDELIKTCKLITKLYHDNDMINSDIDYQAEEFWREVKEEIENL